MPIVHVLLFVCLFVCLFLCDTTLACRVHGVNSQSQWLIYVNKLTYLHICPLQHFTSYPLLLNVSPLICGYCVVFTLQWHVSSSCRQKLHR